MTLLLLSVLFVVSGCAVGTDWSIPECKDGDPARPCVGVCSIHMKDALTVKVVPYSVKIKDTDGVEHCQPVEL